MADKFYDLKTVYLIDGCRTAIGSLRGSLSSIRTDDLAAIPISFLNEKYKGLLSELVDDVYLGCANQAGEDNRNIARMALLLAGLHYRIPGETINRLCASGMSAIIHGYRTILSGEGDLILAGGVENMTRGPLVMSKGSVPYSGNIELFDSSFGWRFINPKMKAMYGVDSMGETAENLAKIYSIGREEQDSFAYHSQIKALKAQENGRFDKEIIPVSISKPKTDPISFDKDEFIKGNTTMDGLSKLNPAFDRECGTVTAGNSSGLNDGAAITLLASEYSVINNNLRPLCRIVSSGVVGVEPRIMGIGPVGASELALKRAGLTMDQMSIIEINEAFAVQVLSCLRELHVEADDNRVNPNGGAIALGHPLGMSGTRIIYSAALELNIRRERYALVTMCIGVGQGYAVILENVNI